MKTKNLISIGFLIVLILLLSLIYHDRKQIKESFQGYAGDPYMMPLASPTPNISVVNGLSPIPNVDTSTMNRLYQLAKDIKEVKSDKVPQESLDKLSQEIVREIRGLQLAFESQKKINASLAKSGNQEMVDSLSDGSLINRETIREKQLLQNYRIQKMEDRIRNLRKTYQDFLARKNQAHYPKIPIYSSCVVAEPEDGVVDSDNQYENKSGNNASNESAQIMNALGQSTLPVSSMAYNPFKPKPTPEAKKETPTLEKVLEMLSQGEDINLNFDIKTPQQ